MAFAKYMQIAKSTLVVGLYSVFTQNCSQNVRENKLSLSMVGVKGMMEHSL